METSIKAKKKEEIAKKYGLKLDSIEQINIKNKEFFKFVDPETKEVRILENNSDKNLDEQFKKNQEKLSFARTSDEMDNAKRIFDYEQKHNKTILNFIPISSLCRLENGVLHTTNMYANITYGLSNEKKMEIKNLLQISIALNIKSINIENSIALDVDNKVIGSTYNPSNSKCDVNYATVTTFKNDKKQSYEDDIEVNLDNINFDLMIEQMETTPVQIEGEMVNLNDIEKYYEYPEVFKKENMSKKRHTIIDRLLQAYEKRKMNSMNKNNQKVKNLLLKKNDGFVDQLVFSLIVGFLSGVVLTIFLLIITNS